MMEYKISEVVERCGVPKSTILYYIKEGLLPEARKIKPNVHRYNDEHVELIHYIKYMQSEFGASTHQIRAILQERNRSFAGSSSMLAPLMQTLADIDDDAVHYDRASFVEKHDLDAALLQTLIDDGIVQPLKADDFTHKELSVYRLVEQFLSVGADYTILKTYVHHARELGKLEGALQKQLCTYRNDLNFTTLWQIMFGTLFNARQYIFNRSSYQVLECNIRAEITQQNPSV